MANLKQLYKIIYQKSVLLKEESIKLYRAEKKEIDQKREKIREIQESYKDQELKILNTKREIESFLDDAKEHYLSYPSLKAKNTSEIDMPFLKTLRLQIDDYSEYDSYARELYECCLGCLELINRVLKKINLKQQQKEHDIKSCRNSDYRIKKQEIDKQYDELLQSQEVDKLVKYLEQVRQYTYPNFKFQYNPPKKEPSFFYIGEVSVPLFFPKYTKEKVERKFKDLYDFDAQSLIIPKYFLTDSGKKMYIEYESEMEHLVTEGTKGVISNVLRCFPACPGRITYIDPITYNSLYLGEMQKVISRGKHLGLIKFPEEKREVKSALSLLEEDLKKETENARMRFLIIKGYPDYYDSESREILQRLCASADIYHLVVLLMKEAQESERRTSFENQIIKRSIRLKAQNNKFILQNGEKSERQQFFWYPPVEKIADEELAKIQKAYIPKDKGTRYLERINPAFPPKYQRGNRRIQWSLGINSSDNIHVQNMESLYFATFLMGGSGSGKSTLLENLINHLIMTYHPDDVELWIMDLKGTAQITNIVDHCPPHIKYLLVPKGDTMIFSFLDRIEGEYKRRIDFLNNIGRPEKYKKYPKWENALEIPKEVYFPAIFVIIDEVSILSQAIEKTEGTRYTKNYRLVLQNILTQSRAAGFHFIFANQKFTSGLSGFSKTAMEQIRVRMAMSAAESTEIQDTVNISRKYLTEKQILWMDNLPPYQVLLAIHPQNEGEKPTMDKMKTLYLPDADRAIQYERFDWLNNKMRGVRSYNPDKMATYVEKHPILYTGEKYTFDECRRDMEKYCEKYSKCIDYNADDIILFPGYPLNLLPVDPIIVKQSENENITFFIDENNYIEKLANTIFSCLRSIDLEQTDVEIWSLKNDKKLKIFSKYWNKFKCISSEEDICARVRELKEGVLKENLNNTCIIVFKPYAIEHSIDRKMEFLKMKEQNKNEKISVLDINQDDSVINNELGNELSIGAISNIMGISGILSKKTSESEELYNIEEDLKELCKYGSERKLHFIMVENSWSSFKQTGLKIEWFKHVFTINLPQNDSINIPFGSIADKTEDDKMFYTNGTEYKLFLPYVHERD